MAKKKSVQQTIEDWSRVINPTKSIYCKDCEVEEIVSKDKPNKCPFCESENVEVNRW